MSRGHSVILIDPEEQSRAVLIERLRMQGYQAKGFAGPVEGANAALCSPPAQSSRICGWLAFRACN